MTTLPNTKLLLFFFFCSIFSFKVTLCATTGGGSCQTSSDCAFGNGHCSPSGTCICWSGYTCSDCSVVCSGSWPSGCSNTCEQVVTIERGGAKCTDCMDCFNCDGGQCVNGKCECFFGWTCPNCELSTESTTRVCNFVSPSEKKASGSSGLNSGEIFGVVFAGCVVGFLGLMCARGSISDAIQLREAKRTRIAAPKATVTAIRGQATVVPTMTAYPVQSHGVSPVHMQQMQMQQYPPQHQQSIMAGYPPQQQQVYMSQQQQQLQQPYVYSQPYGHPNVYPTHPPM